MRSVGSHLGTTNTQDFVLLGIVALAGYVIYNLVQGVKTAADEVGTAASAVGRVAATAYTSTVDAVASGLYALFGPADVGTSMYFTTAFPDGSHHAVPSNIVDSDGIFNWTGYPAGSEPPVTLRLVKDSSGHWFATTPG